MDSTFIVMLHYLAKVGWCHSCDYFMLSDQIRSVAQRVRLFATPWIAACQASLSITNSWSSLRLTSIKSVMPSSHLILCRPLLLLPPRDGEAWWAAVYGVAQSRTRLSDWSDLIWYIINIYHWLDGRESQWTPGVGDGQGGLACCDSWGCKESDTLSDWSDLIW